MLFTGPLWDQATLYRALWKFREQGIALLSLEEQVYSMVRENDSQKRKDNSMPAVTLLREQIQQAHAFLQATVEDVTNEQAHWLPPGTANPLAATYVHAIASEDLAINMVLKGGAPLYTERADDETGISEVQPLSTSEWARRVRVDMPILLQYARLVHATTDAYLATLNDDDLARELDLANFGLGQMTVGVLLSRMVLAHIDNMCGEISVLKGLQGAKGYPI